MSLVAYLPALGGGLLIGAAVVLLLLVNGRVAGVSGIFGRLLAGQQRASSLAFVLGLVLGPLLLSFWLQRQPALTVVTAWPQLLLAGLLVGFGTRLGSGCTSGHGILGVARGSRRSLAATAVFLLVGLATATLVGGLP